MKIYEIEFETKEETEKLFHIEAGHTQQVNMFIIVNYSEEEIKHLISVITDSLSKERGLVDRLLNI